ncbi:hypothetical protein KRZ98_16775 [Sphingobium sp. AS12]|uniref:hypothetical protein n=1 Tax=Sphingobium sp. AS12 TaxID=2849495 RepID=UPI001C315158|nr:hypothetical protein [Sphingobium sp. AS12]MBV2149900.1 hypothetical protein [Sphingobium sp. AS12]
MPDKVTSRQAQVETDLDLISQLPVLTVALSEAEYDAANIFAFDPEALLPAGALSGTSDTIATGPDNWDYRLPGSHMDKAAWTRLARACVTSAADHGAATCLAMFLAERALEEPATTRSVDHDPSTATDRRICMICDGGPGNDGVCLCGARHYAPAAYPR